MNLRMLSRNEGVSISKELPRRQDDLTTTPLQLRHQPILSYLKPSWPFPGNEYKCCKIMAKFQILMFENYL